MKTHIVLLVTLSVLFMAAPAGHSDNAVPLTLDGCIEIAIENATQIRQQQNLYELTGATVLERYGQFLPNLILGANYGYQSGTELYTIQGRTLVESHAQTAGFNISSTLNIFNGLADYSGVQSAMADRRSSSLTLEWAKQQVILDITQTYLQLVLDQELLEIAQKNLVASQSRLKLLQGQADVGSASLPDLYRQDAETSADRFAIASDQARVTEDQALLLRKLRIDPMKSYRFEAPNLDPVPTDLANRPIDQLANEAITARADVSATQAHLEATDWDITRATSTYLPRLDLVFQRNAVGSLLSQEIVNGVDTLNYSQPSLTSQLGNQVEYSIGLNLSWSVFDRFVTHLNVEQARVTRDNTEINFEDSKLQVQADLRTALAGYASALQQIDAAKSGLRSAQKSYDAITGMYRLGSASIVDVLTAQAALVQAQSNQAQALTNFKLQKSTLEYAAGKLRAAAPKKT